MVVRKESLSFIDPRTNSPLRTNEGKQKPIIEYLEESYAGIEELQKIVRLADTAIRQGLEQPCCFRLLRIGSMTRRS